jgi:hypothetical protein
VAEFFHAHPKLLPPSAKAPGLTLFCEDGPGAFTRVCEDDLALPVEKRGEEGKVGVSRVSWSPDGRFVCTTNENMPSAVWIWDAEFGGLYSVMVLRQPLCTVAWAPNEATPAAAKDEDGGKALLCIGAGGPMMYFWSLTGAWCMPSNVPKVTSVQWAEIGNVLLVGGPGVPSAFMVYPRSAVESPASC